MRLLWVENLLAHGLFDVLVPIDDPFVVLDHRAGLIEPPGLGKAVLEMSDTGVKRSEQMEPRILVNVFEDNGARPSREGAGLG